MTDYQATLYDPIYLIQGVAVVLTLPDSGGVFDFTALDKTAGADVGDQGAQVQTIKPVAALRVPELTAQGVAVTDLPKSTLAMNGFNWNVVSYKLKPSPLGENDGEVYLILTGKVALDSEADSELDSEVVLTWEE